MSKRLTETRQQLLREPRCQRGARHIVKLTDSLKTKSSQIFCNGSVNSQSFDGQGRKGRFRFLRRNDPAYSTARKCIRSTWRLRDRYVCIDSHPLKAHGDISDDRPLAAEKPLAPRNIDERLADALKRNRRRVPYKPLAKLLKRLRISMQMSLDGDKIRADGARIREGLPDKKT